jgi:hypothetical protein
MSAMRARIAAVFSAAVATAAASIKASRAQWRVARSVNVKEAAKSESNLSKPGIGE